MANVQRTLVPGAKLCQARTREPLPTHADLTTFLEAFLPPSLNPATQAREVPYLYHTPRHPSYSPTTQHASRIIFSITPTSGVYKALHATCPRHTTPVAFLHRPFNLDRRAVRRGALVLACHKSFDEHLTVGWNVALGQRLGLDLTSAICIKGYKGDDDRKIGLVAKLENVTGLGPLLEKIRGEFSGAGEVFGARAGREEVVARTDGDAKAPAPTSAEDVESERPISVLAIMNAFHAEEVDRVLLAAHTTGWIDDVKDGRHLLYLTGAAREYGIEAVAKVGMPAFCVGHVACEEWGIRYLAQQTRDRWPGLDVVEVFEEEEPRPAPKASDKENKSTDNTC